MNKTTVVNLRRDPYDVYIGRGSPFGNPFTHLSRPTLASVQVDSRAEAIARYKEYFYEQIEKSPEFRAQVLTLRGKVLGCYCKQSDREVSCHGDVIKEYLDNL